MRKVGKIRIGPAGWSYADWENVVYPPHGSRFDHLAYLASYFDTIEVNSAFYRIPPPTHSQSWVRRVAANDAFRFTTKIYRGFTHDAGFPSADEVTAFRKYLEPLASSERLGAILVQFPWSFRNSAESIERLEKIFDALAPWPLALEVRHATFQDADFHRWLDDRGVSWVNVDQPLFSDSVKPADTVTGTIAYARFHGRNYTKWFAHAESWERYDYLYSKEELEPWVGRIEAMASARDTYVVMNNHFRGQAIVNAGELKRSLGLDGALPPQLATVYGDRV